MIQTEAITAILILSLILDYWLNVLKTVVSDLWTFRITASVEVCLSACTVFLFFIYTIPATAVAIAIITTIYYSTYYFYCFYCPSRHDTNALFSDSTTGPFSLLQRAVNEKLRVKVWTRSYHHIWGICTGFLVAYDKHWNLVSIINNTASF